MDALPSILNGWTFDDDQVCASRIHLSQTRVELMRVSIRAHRHHLRSDEAFALVPAAHGTFKLVLQKREASATPQELLAQFAENPSELLAKQLDALASGSRQDSDLYVSDVQINSNGNGSYALQLSAPNAPSGASPQITPLSPANPTPTPTTPAPGQRPHRCPAGCSVAVPASR